MGSGIKKKKGIGTGVEKATFRSETLVVLV